MICIINGKVILDEEIVLKNVFIKDDKIVEISSRKPIDEKIIDAKGLYVSPGFIDLHTHGRSGYDTMDASFTSLNEMSKAHLKTGVTSFLPTTVTNDIEKIYNAVENVALNKDKVEGSKVLGVHLEGPFINASYKGAQPLHAIINPSIENYNKLVGCYNNVIKKITLAIEIEGSDCLIEKLVSNNISVSIGHSNATYDQCEMGYKLGVNSTTHTFNAMSPLKHREPGVVGFAMLNDNIFTELILDGKHVSFAASKVLANAKDDNHLVLVTDSLEAAGMKEGEYTLGGQKIFVKDGRAQLTDGTIAGSIISMNKEVYNAINYLNIPIVKAVKYASTNPSLSIFENKLGKIQEGYIADIILFDENIDIKHVIVNGNIKF